MQSTMDAETASSPTIVAETMDEVLTPTPIPTEIIVQSTNADIQQEQSNDSDQFLSAVWHLGVLFTKPQEFLEELLGSGTYGFEKAASSETLVSKANTVDMGEIRVHYRVENGVIIDYELQNEYHKAAQNV